MQYDEWEVEVLQKIDSGEELSEAELRELLEFEVEREYGDNRRWSRSVDSIVRLCDRFFCLCWEEGLTERQENEFYNQPYEVEEHTYEKTVTVTEWIKKVSPSPDATAS